MSTLTVTTINTANGSTDLTFGTGNTSAGKVVINSGGGLVLYQNSSSNSFVANSTATMLQVSGANAVVANSTVTQIQVAGSNTIVANSTVTTLAVGGTTGLTVNTTAAVFGGTVADSTATLRPLVLMTAVTLTTQSTVDFTGIPSWVKRIVFIYYGISLNGTDVPLVQLGTSGGIVSSGYQSYNSDTARTSTAGIILGGATSTDTRYGTLEIVNQDGNKWLATGIGSFSSSLNEGRTIGYINLGATLTQLRLSRTGTNTFDAGSINVIYQ